MRRNCNLELRLASESAPPLMEGQEGSGSPQQQLTIFYNGRVCVCDVTELQARAILTFAGREMEEKMKSPSRLMEPASPCLQMRSPSSSSPSTGLSMKRSLQRFLQKRKNRIHETSPYHH